MEDEKKLIEAIKNYAKAYEELEKIQRDTEQTLIPIGDQKTGAIGEYIGKKILEEELKCEITGLTFLGHSQIAADVGYNRINPIDENDEIQYEKYYQIKTISCYNNPPKIKGGKQLSQNTSNFHSKINGKEIDGLLIIVFENTKFIEGRYYYINNCESFEKDGENITVFRDRCGQTISTNFLDNIATINSIKFEINNEGKLILK